MQPDFAFVPPNPPPQLRPKRLVSLESESDVQGLAQDALGSFDDEDDDGWSSSEEEQEPITWMGEHELIGAAKQWTFDELDALWLKYDNNNSGQISFGEIEKGIQVKQLNLCGITKNQTCCLKQSFTIYILLHKNCSYSYFLSLFVVSRDGAVSPVRQQRSIDEVLTSVSHSHLLSHHIHILISLRVFQ